ncbi:MAG: hypothetical protein ACTHW2_06815, partial [Tissierella sp.]|uniref:hypothetical protein n=1 Tax=Tissierella sp. TaxID=41274 RepID=UPI003F999735
LELDKARKKRQISVNGVSKYLGVSISGFYNFINRKESKQLKRKKKIKQLITEIYNESNQNRFLINYVDAYMRRMPKSCFRLF